MVDTDVQALAATLNDDEPSLDVVRLTSVANTDRYGVVREHARGGLGRILEANDRTLGRKVAIKELRVGGAANRARFVREAMITARLQHPSIIPLYDMGRWASGDPYYAMKLVAGRSFDQVIAGAETLDERLALVPHVIAVADAIAYAHSQRIIHRDLKPQNVLVGDFGETVVIDWGLAKDLDREEIEIEDRTPYRARDLLSPLTGIGEVVGTPLYMAPEQAAGSVLDERADVYSIGAILYELLTGERPHRGASSAQVIARLINGDAVTPVEQVQPAVPPELATIVAKAMTFDVDGRYRSAHELAADLRRFQTGQLVAAHRYSRGTLARRWAHKHRHAVAVAAILVAVLAGTVVTAVRSVIAERDATRAERDRLILVQAKGELERDPTAAVAWLKTYPADGADQAGAREIALDAEARGVARYVLQRDIYAYAGSVSPDGTKFAQSEPSGVRVIELATGATVFATPLPLRSLEWSPDSQHLVAMSGSSPRTLVMLDLLGRATPLRGVVGRAWDTRALLFSADSKTMLVPTIDRGLRQYHHDGTGAAVWTPFAFDGYVRDDDRLAALAPDGSVWWWRLGATTATRLVPPAGVTLAKEIDAFVFAGAQLAAGTADGRLCVWSLADGSAKLYDGNGSAIHELQASSDGRTIASLSIERGVRIWQPAAGTSHDLRGLDGIVAAQLARDGSRIVIAHRDRTIELVDTATGARQHVAIQPTSMVGVALSDDGAWVQSEDDTSTRLFHVAAPNARIIVAHDAAILTASIAGDGETVVTGGYDEDAHVWTTTGHHTLGTDKRGVSAIAIASDAIVTGGFDGTLRVWDRATGEPRGPAVDAHGGMMVELALASNDTAVTTNRSGDIRTWNLRDSSTRVLAKVPGADFIAMAPDGERVAAADGSGALHVIALGGPRGSSASPAAQQVLPSAGAPSYTAAYAPDGSVIVGGDELGQVVEWNPAAGTARVLAHMTEHVRRVRFSRDGAWLATADATGSVMVWNTRTHAARSIAAAACEVNDIAYVGDVMLTTACDATVRAWSLADGSLRSVVHLEASATVLRASADGRYVVATTNGREGGFAYRMASAAFASHSTQLAQLTAFELGGREVE